MQLQTKFRSAIDQNMADPQKYRDEANRILAEAETTHDAEHKAKLTEIARLYQNLAENVAKRPSKIQWLSLNARRT
jgi:hypothetical protein